MKRHKSKNSTQSLAFYIIVGISTINAATAPALDPLTEQLRDFFAHNPVAGAKQPSVLIDQHPKKEERSNQNKSSNAPARLDPLIEQLLEFFSPAPKAKL
jgi:hypothetical protein